VSDIAITMLGKCNMLWSTKPILGSHARSEAHLFLRLNASLKADSSTVEDTAIVESP